MKIGVDTILLDPTVPEIFYFQHDVDDSNVINFNNFIGNPEDDNLIVVRVVCPVLT